MAADSHGWPSTSLNVPAMIEQGWSPTPFREFVIKIHQRCNLACSYCYVYTKADQSWRTRPVPMPDDVQRATIDRIAEHVENHDLGRIRVILHGGEPLLAGAERLAGLAGSVRRALRPQTDVQMKLQTNGTLLDESALTLLVGAGITIGLSLDGTASLHDRHRKYVNGRASHDTVVRAITMLRTRFPESFGGLLAMVDLAEDPVECYEALLALEPPALDFLLPHANWSDPPPRRAGDPADGFGRWLAAAFDRWYGAPTREVRARTFESLISLVLGGPSRSDQLGLDVAATIVVESDGAMEQVDSLKSAYHGAAATPWNVLHDPFDAALLHPGFVARQIGAAALSETCLDCPIHRICGGGHYAHRYRAGVGFRNPSVYCRDLRYLVDHVRSRIAADLAAAA
jgi:uncharacterized protein